MCVALATQPGRLALDLMLGSRLARPSLVFARASVFLCISAAPDARYSAVVLL